MGLTFPPVQSGPVAHPASCTMGTGSFPGVKYGRGVLLTTHPLLVPRSWKSRAIPLPNLWAKTGPVTGTLYFYPFIHVFGKPILCLHISSQQLTAPEAVAAAITARMQQEGCNDSISFRTISLTLWRCSQCVRSETVTYLCSA